ncbi:hypothetical protein D3C86_1981140 [compost metagenome]
MLDTACLWLCGRLGCGTARLAAHSGLRLDSPLAHNPACGGITGFLGRAIQLGQGFQIALDLLERQATDAVFWDSVLSEDENELSVDAEFFLGCSSFFFASANVA